MYTLEMILREKLVTPVEINEVLNSGMEYILVDISVFNVGAVFSFETSEHSFWEDIQLGDEWNGYTFETNMDEFFIEVEKFGKIIEVDDRFAYIPYLEVA